MSQLITFQIVKKKKKGGREVYLERRTRLDGEKNIRRKEYEIIQASKSR